MTIPSPSTASSTNLTPSPESSLSTSLPSSSFSSSSNPFSTARSLVLLQLLSRLLTFTLNQTLVRLASPSVFGTAAIQFDLICSTILFLSREGIRNALLRQSPSTSTDQLEKVEGEQIERQNKSLSIIPLRLGTCIAILITSLYIYSSDGQTTSQANFYPSLFLYVLSSLLELSIEPIYIRIHRSSPPKLEVRVQAEGGMAIVKAILTVSSLLLFGEGNALLAFAFGQLAGAIWLVGRYLIEVQWDITSLFWSKGPKGKAKYNPQTLSLAIANTGQSVIKHILTEADRLAVARISPLEDQGGYAVAMNYGSLIARIIFQPIEESLLLHFSASLSSSSTLPLLSLALRLSTTLTLIIRTFVPPLFPIISTILLPRQYATTTAPQVLKIYLTTYIPVMSLNGLLESFHTASCTSKQVKKQVRWMVFSSLIFATSLFALTNESFTSLSLSSYWTYIPEWIKRDLNRPSREEALVLSSSFAMIIRIIYALQHARSFFASKGKLLRWSMIFPAVEVYAWSWVVWYILSSITLTSQEMHVVSLVELVRVIGTGGVLGVITLCLVYWSERSALAELKTSMRDKRE